MAEHDSRKMEEAPAESSLLACEARDVDVVPAARRAGAKSRVKIAVAAAAALAAAGALTAMLRGGGGGMSVTEKGALAKTEKLYGPYDCNANWATWETSWVPEQKAWCCRDAGRGCPAATRAPIFEDLDHDITDGWRVPHPGYHGSGGQAPAFDCDAGYGNMEDGWSAPKRSYCCQRAGRGCAPSGYRPEPPTTYPVVPYPARPSTYPVVEAPAFDCNAGFDNWAAGWSASKQQYCCKETGRGCGAPARAARRCAFEVGDKVRVKVPYVSWSEAVVLSTPGYSSSSNQYTVMLEDRGVEKSVTCSQIRGAGGFRTLFLASWLWVLAALSLAAVALGLCAACGACERFSGWRRSAGH